jgi:DNA-binding transcriptional LysR family regulator
LQSLAGKRIADSLPCPVVHFDHEIGEDIKSEQVLRGNFSRPIIVRQINICYGRKPCELDGKTIINCLLTETRVLNPRVVSMELHQIRYFLSLSKTLNFTRAADECNVSQPALSRAISQLEGELGAELFRRERSLTHMTDFGQSILPELRNCYEASLNAKVIAREFLREGQAPLNLALSRTIEMDLLSPLLGELATAFPRIEIKISRGPSREVGEKLRNGEAEIGISGPLGDNWERLEARKIYEQHFGLLLNNDHRLSKRNAIELADLKVERLLSRPHCTLSEMLVARLKELGGQNITKHEVPSIDDLPGLVQANFGVGIWPVARKVPENLLINQVHGIDMSRWIHVHTVFGRRLSVGASTLIGLLRARDWPAPVPPAHWSGELVH